MTPFFETLYEATYRETLLYLTRKCADPAQLPDLIQEVYTEVYAVLAQKGTAYLKDPHAFVRHIAKSKLRQFYTLRQRLACLIPLQKDGPDGEVYDDPEVAALAVLDPLPAQLAEDRALAGQIAAALKRCPADVQKIFVCRFALDLTLEETAATLGMNVSTVKAKLYRTLRKLRELYAKEGAEDE